MVDSMTILFLCLIVPLFLTTITLHSEAKIRMIFFSLGLFICFFCSYINGALTEVIGLSRYEMTYMVTPVTEELLKAIPVLLYAFLFNPKRSSLLECAMMVGIGFAMLENAYILLSVGEGDIRIALIRGFGAGLMHGVSTLVVGYGISFTHLRKKLFFVGTYAMLVAAIVYHACYNLLIQSRWDYAGILLTVLPYASILLGSQWTGIRKFFAGIRVKQLEKSENKEGKTGK